MTEFIALAGEYDKAVERSAGGISPVCSSSAWTLAAHEALHGKRETLILEDDGCWLALASGDFLGIPRTLQPLEVQWGFACPFAGPDAARRAPDMLKEALDGPHGRYNAAFLCGIPHDGPLRWALQKGMGPLWEVEPFPGCDCDIVSMEGGFEDFLVRRSPKFRAQARRALRKAEEAGLSYDYVSEKRCGDIALKRALNVEGRSWKVENGESVFQAPNFLVFYHELLTRASNTGRLRALFLRDQGTDIAYAFGAVVGGVYRGFQMSYDKTRAQLSPGVVSQLLLLRKLADEGVRKIDLGMRIDYKSRWADETLPICNLLIWRKGAGGIHPEPFDPDPAG